MMTFLYVLLAIVILLFMVLIHEFGHYIAGKILKFKITEFSVGFGKAIFSKTTKSGEKFSLRLFPLGGYCAFYGEDEQNGEVVDKEKAFNNQKPWKRIIVFLAGVTANFITAIIFSWILLCTIGYDTTEIINYSTTYNYNVETGESIFAKGDIVTKIEGQNIDFAFGGVFSEMIAQQKSKAKQFYEAEDYDGSQYTFSMTVNRQGQLQDLTVTVCPYVYTENNETKTTYVIGLEEVVTGYACTKAYVYGFFEGLGRSFSVAFGFAWVVLKSLWMLITFQVPITQMGGTITTISFMATTAQANPIVLLVFIPLIAANLAVFNLLPFPALDGSHVVFTLIEWIRRKPINRKVESMIHFVGLCILFAFVVIVDILHFVL